MEEIWDTEAAESYDTPGVGMFSPEVLLLRIGTPAWLIASRTKNRSGHLSITGAAIICRSLFRTAGTPL